MKQILFNKTTSKAKRLIMVAAIFISGISQAWAYDFSAVSPSGHTLYYEIISGTTNVGVVRPGSGTTYNNYISGNVVIPDTVSYNDTTYNVTELKVVGYYGTFDNCTGLTSVIIPNSVTTIGDYAFYVCTGLTSVVIPNSVTTIGKYAFKTCTGLTSVTIPASVTTICEGVFKSCTGLTSVTIPNSVTTIGDWAFKECTGLTTLNFNAINCSGFVYGYNPFNGCPISTITIGDSVQRIPGYFACELDSLRTLTIGNSVTSIGYSAFFYCTGLTSVVMGPVDTIGGYAFYGCTSIARIDVKSVTPPTISSNSFYSVSSTVPVYIPCGSLSNYSSSAWGSRFSNLQESQVFSFGVAVNDSAMGMASILSNTCASTAIQAYPYDGYNFVGWSDGNTTNPRIVTLTQDTTYIANFAVNTYTITVTSANDSMGTVSGGGIFDYETRINISATPFSGYKFIGWNDGNMDNPRSIVVVNDSTFVANFAPKMRYTLTVSSEDESKGLTIGGGEFEEQTGTNIGAVPRDGYHFKEWSDGDTNRMRHIVLVCDSVLIARFERNVVGIESADALNNLTFYPNPTSATITFNRTDIKKIEVLDAVGRTAAVYENSHIIDLSKLSKGYYTMRITTAEGVAVRRVVRN